jgi:uncharacterized protein YidB (DUF937 family)
MGLFDQVIGAFTGGSSGDGSPGPVALMELLCNHEGGLDGLLQKFNAAGLGETAGPGSAMARICQSPLTWCTRCWDPT